MFRYSKRFIQPYSWHNIQVKKRGQVQGISVLTISV